jgi:cardiolipin synthase
VEDEAARGDLARGFDPPAAPVSEITAGFLTVPNAISLVRLLGVPLFLWLILGPEADGLAILVLMISGFTDWLDGVLARRLNQVSRLGVLLDPAVDRLYILATVVGLVIRDIVPLWFGVLLIARDGLLALSLPILRSRGYGPPPVHFLGKAATFNLLYAFPLLLLGDGSGPLATLALAFGWAFAIWGMGLYWWAGILYVVQIRQLLTGEMAAREEVDP